MVSLDLSSSADVKGKKTRGPLISGVKRSFSGGGSGGAAAAASKSTTTAAVNAGFIGNDEEEIGAGDAEMTSLEMSPPGAVATPTKPAWIGEGRKDAENEDERRRDVKSRRDNNDQSKSTHLHPPPNFPTATQFHF